MSGTLSATEEIPERNLKTFIEKVLAAYRHGGIPYIWHKSMRRGLDNWPSLKRKAIYSDPRDYWTLRGGVGYLAEQEGQPARTARSLWLAGKVASCQPLSILEVGCGYGKQIRNIRDLVGEGIPITGVDYSPTQLSLAKKHLSDQKNIRLMRASGERLPFADGAFDMVLTSAVILHNPPVIAEKIRLEILRVAKNWCLHNEDTDITYNRYGYDTAEWYRNHAFTVVESGPIPADVFQGSDDPVGESLRSQFCMVRL
ncbi:MAG: class I SAM-dependent methyltransferase [bacterium]